jgi:hypothetical protein
MGIMIQMRLFSFLLFFFLHPALFPISSNRFSIFRIDTINFFVLNYHCLLFLLSQYHHNFEMFCLEFDHFDKNMNLFCLSSS